MGINFLTLAKKFNPTVLKATATINLIAVPESIMGFVEMLT